MATEQRLITYGFPASADLSASQFCAVNVDANGNLALATAGKNCDGVLQDKPTALGQAGEIAIVRRLEGALGRDRLLGGGPARGGGQRHVSDEECGHRGGESGDYRRRRRNRFRDPAQKQRGVCVATD